MVKNWKKISSKPLGDYRIFTIRQDRCLSPRTGQEHQFFILESRNWINVIPLTPEGNVVFIYQFRHGIAEVTLEIPGGIVDAEDSSSVEAARRELLEETGYAVDDVIHIGSVAPNPAFLNNRCDTFLALGARKISAPQFDGSEDIAVQEIPLPDVPSLIRNGRISHALVVAAFYHLERYQEQKKQQETPSQKE